MMKKLLFSLAFSLACVTLPAQHRVGTWSLVPRVGVNLANISPFEVFDGSMSSEGVWKEKARKSKYREGLVAGLDVQYQLNKQLAASAGLFYSVQGMRFPAFEAVDADKVHYASDYFEWRYDYLALPIVLHGYGPKGLSLNAGIQIGFLLSAKGTGIESRFYVDEKGKTHYLTDDSGNLLYARTSKYSMLGSCRRIDVSIPLGLSYEYANVVLDARYNFGLTLLSRQADDKYRNKVFSFTVGYRFGL